MALIDFDSLELIMDISIDSSAAASSALAPNSISDLFIASEMLWN